jgi:proline iminopeptidase
MRPDVALPAASTSPARNRLLDHRWFGIALSVALVTGWGLAGGLTMPRGPLTTGQALITMVLSLLVGAAAGLLTGSRWAMVGAPVLYALVYEVVRLGVEGPTVDGLRLSTYGLIAFVAGRGAHGLLAVLPMVLGAAIGAGIARKSLTGSEPAAAGRTGRIARRTVAAVTGVLLVALGVAVARPASTDPITAADPSATPVAELTTVDVDGRPLGLLVRGHDVTNPVLLFMAGGPGGSELGAMRNHLPALEQHFTVVTWDQRGAGRSYPALDPVATLTVDSMVADTLAVTDHLRARFGQDRIYLLGQSWGSTLGVLAVQAAPEKYVAFIGTGQMVSQLATDTAFYQDALSWAGSTGRTNLHQELTEIGPPPYASILNYETALTQEHEVYPYDHSANSEGAGGFSENLLVPEYSLIEQVHLLGAFMDSFTALYPQLQGIDFRDGTTRFDVPVFFVQGRNEAGGRARLFDEWYPTIEAPAKDVTYLATSGHRPLFEQPQEFVDYLTGTVLPATQGR